MSKLTKKPLFNPLGDTEVHKAPDDRRKFYKFK